MDTSMESQSFDNQSDGGEGGIRTHGEYYPTSDFESGAIDHSTTSPWDRVIAGRGNCDGGGDL